MFSLLIDYYKLFFLNFLTIFLRFMKFLHKEISEEFQPEKYLKK